MDFEYHDDDALEERISRVTQADPNDETLELGATIRLEAIVFDDDSETLRESDLRRDGSTLRAANPDGYSLEELIGRGGMGVVYRARQESLDRTVALKTTHHRLHHNKQRYDRFVAEAAVTSRLEHPNIIPVHDLGEDSDGEVFFTMKLLEGRSWDRMIYGETAIPGHALDDLDAHLHVLLDVANATAYAHSRGFLHRDLKPENVLVGDFGEVVLTDWGLAARTQEGGDSRVPHVSEARKLAGTPAYFPPEMALGEGSRQGPWTDVYGLGGILYEILCLQPPNEGKSLKEAVRSALSGERSYQSDREFSDELRGICERALAPDPADRFEDAIAFRDALLGYLRHGESSRLATAAEKSRLLALESDSAKEFGVGHSAESRSGAKSSDEHRHTSMALFARALETWPDNEAARRGLRSLRAEWADDAERRGDLALAISQLEGIGDPASRERAARLGKERVRRARQQRSNRRLKTGLIVLLAIAAVASGLGALLITKARDAAVDARDVAVQAREDYDRLAVLSEAELLLKEAEEDFWPLTEVTEAVMKDWLSRRVEVLGQRPRLENLLESLRSRATRRIETPHPQNKWRARLLVQRTFDRGQSRFLIKQCEDELAKPESTVDKEYLHRQIESLEKGLARAEAEILDLSTPLPPLLSYEYRNASDTFVAETLTETLEAIERVEEMGSKSSNSLYSVAVRMVESRRLRAISESEEFERRWQETTKALADIAPYAGIEFGLRPDLYPLKQRSRGGWLRFALLGTDPKRTPLENIEREFAGIILILLPAGNAYLGAHEGQPNTEAIPPVTVPLAPYLLAEAETSQEQFEWVMGFDPSSFAGGRTLSKRCPVESVDAVTSDEFCRRIHAELPSGAQFEYAARQGDYRDGPELAENENPADFFNIADQSRQSKRGPPLPTLAEWNDGFYTVCEIRAQKPDAWGFYQLWGNVSEWTCDVTPPRKRYEWQTKRRRLGEYSRQPSKGENTFASNDRFRDFWGPNYKFSPDRLWAYVRGEPQKTAAGSEVGIRVSITLAGKK
jgi:serine/threonine protein kinase/formylglycine-generating enzyme required for sulfatase activity